MREGKIEKCTEKHCGYPGYYHNCKTCIHYEKLYKIFHFLSENKPCSDCRNHGTDSELCYFKKFDQLVIGSANPGKINEIRNGLEPVKLALSDTKEEAPEDQVTFLGNAKQKAIWYSKRTDLPVVSDDSGLIVPSLNNSSGTNIPLPGVFSARFCDLGLQYDSYGEFIFSAAAKENIPWEQRNQRNRTRLLNIMKTWGDCNRKAFFTCAIVIAHKERIIFSFQTEFHGEIARGESGDFGFGYDPIFIPRIERTRRKENEEQRKRYIPRTLAELSLNEKQKISHRGQALKKLKEWLGY